MSLPTGATGAPFGVYVHVPFCRARCDYCAFATWTDQDHLIEAYTDALVAELAARRAAGLRPATSVYVGGGTPSRIPAASLQRVLGAVERAARCEVTVECNPEDVDADRLGQYRDAGVTRISLGIQSTRAHVLAALGRRHGTGALRAVAALVDAAGFESWSVDLVFGAVGERDDDLVATLDDVLGLASPPPHVSAYALTPEPGTPLFADTARHPDEDVLARRYELVDDRLGAAGYRWEEISNWAKPGHEARHNWLYWTQGEYAGIGCSAHSHLDGVRSWNVRTPRRYIELVAAGADPTTGSEVLDGAQRRFEALALRLRTRDGVPASWVEDVDALGDLVERRGEHVVLTVRGRLLANEVTARIAEGAAMVAR